MPAIEDMSDVVRMLATGSYVVKRPAGGSFVDGRFVPSGEPIEQTVVAAVLPASGEVLAQWAEGDYATDVRSVLTTFKLAVDDVIVIDELDFKIMSVEPWDVAGGFVKAVAHRRDVG